jgi:hypothetical protein
MNKATVVVLLATALAIGACSKNSSAGTEANPPAPTPAAQATNPTNFPLVTGAMVIAARPFTQTVTTAQMATGAFAAGSGTYSGNEVIAGSNASFQDLQNWLRQSEKKPPSGYTAVVIPASMASIHAIAVKNGMDFALFRDAANPKHGLVVVAMDPNAANAKLGPAIGLVSRYESLPQALRSGIDTQLKNRYGYTASEFVEPGSPLGSAVGALSDFRNKNERGIIILDAAKQ